MGHRKFLSFHCETFYGESDINIASFILPFSIERSNKVEMKLDKQNLKQLDKFLKKGNLFFLLWLFTLLDF